MVQRSKPVLLYTRCHGLHHAAGKGQGWDRKIGYTATEYQSLYEKAKEVRARIQTAEGKEVAAEELEKAAYGICKEAKEFPEDDGDSKTSGTSVPAPKRETLSRDADEREPSDSAHPNSLKRCRTSTEPR